MDFNAMVDSRFTRNVLIKTVLLFAAFNLLFAAIDPVQAFGKLSAYNAIFPGRPRLPFGENPDKAYNFSIYSLDAMLASHEINAHRAATPAGATYRVIVVGDSSVWGTLLTPQQTLVGQINAANLKTADGRVIRAYNLGYPTLSLTKDLLILTLVKKYHPDMIVWMVTLESFPVTRQLTSPILQHNADLVRGLIHANGVRLNSQDPQLVDLSFWQKTIVGRRRDLADIFRLQLYGIPWAATGIDQYYPDTYDLRANDLDADPTFDGLKPPHLVPADLSLDVLKSGLSLYRDIPVWVVNEPIFISNGRNSDIRYNFYYPRWAYDDYRQILQSEATQAGWHYLDLWNLIQPSEFTNSAIHLTPYGASILAGKVGKSIIGLAGSKQME
ncbi:MAG TPA: hypothetical protein VF326_06575 [Anaerolineaceae bacterium]